MLVVLLCLSGYIRVARSFVRTKTNGISCSCHPDRPVCPVYHVQAGRPCCSLWPRCPALPPHPVCRTQFLTLVGRLARLAACAFELLLPFHYCQLLGQLGCLRVREFLKFFCHSAFSPNVSFFQGFLICVTTSDLVSFNLYLIFVLRRFVIFGVIVSALFFDCQPFVSFAFCIFCFIQFSPLSNYCVVLRFSLFLLF